MFTWLLDGCGCPPRCAAVLLAAVCLGGNLLAADPAAISSNSSGGGLIARAKQTLTGGWDLSGANDPVSGNGKAAGRTTANDSAAEPHDSLDRQQPSKTTLGAPPVLSHWWKPRHKPVRRTALDFWSQDSTVH